MTVQSAGLVREPTASQPRKLTNIQALRAFAASSVVLSHSGRWLWTSGGDDVYHVVFNDHLGSFGVILFFAISGFLMVQLARSSDAGSFLLHRIVRIYPAFLLCAALWLPLRPLVGDSARPDLVALTLAPASFRDYPLGIEWTLVYEISFYVLIYGIAVCGAARSIEWIAIAWLVLLAAVSALGLRQAQTEPFPFIHTVLIKDANVAFALGLLLPAAMRRGLLPAKTFVIGTVLAAIGIWGQLEPIRWLLALPAILILAGLVQAEQIGTQGFAQKTAIKMGDGSYALYLVHMPILALWYKIGFLYFPSSIVFWMSSASAILVAVAIGSLDVLLYRRLRLFVDGLRPSLRTIGSAGFASAYLLVGALVLAKVVSRWGWP